MQPPIKSISLLYCRGIKDLQLSLKGSRKNWLLHGGNGKCKTSVVMGFEWLFSGNVDGIQPKAIPHIDATQDDTPKVEIVYANNEGTVSREIKAGADAVATKNGLQYFNAHPSPDSFILRRTKLLNFLNEKPRDRYQRLIGLLGVDWLNGTQDAFNKASETAAANLQAIESDLKRIYDKHPHHDTSAQPPDNTVALLDLCNHALSEAKLPSINSQKELPVAQANVQKRRKPESRQRLASVENAISLIDQHPSLDWEVQWEEVKAARKVVKGLMGGLSNPQEVELLRPAIAYLKESRQSDQCPVCERPYTEECSHQGVLDNLVKREKAILDFQAAGQRNGELTAQLSRDIKSTIDSLRRTLASIKGIVAPALHTSAVNSVNDLELKTNTLDQLGKQPDYPKATLSAINQSIKAMLTALKSEQVKLTAASPAHIELANMVVSNVIRDLPKIEALEKKQRALKLVADKAAKAQAAFKTAKEKALENFLDKIAARVKEFYDFIHIDDSRVESSECTAISLKPKGWGKLGSLVFKTDFMDTVKGTDPQQYLSEGHLDSLGLCIYLASVKEFNPPGSLLIIDDVLTSVDQEHRHRVAELILEEFKEYQLVITTHDQAWFERLKERIRADKKHAGLWDIKEFTGWSRDNGPVLTPDAGAKAALQKAHKEGNLRFAGGPIRIITESFCKKTAEAVGLKVTFVKSGLYTAVAFKDAGLGDRLQTEIEKNGKKRAAAMEKDGVALSDDQKANLADSIKMQQADITTIFGASFLNQLVHDKPDLSAVQEEELKAFTEALFRIELMLPSAKLAEICHACTGKKYYE